MAAKKGRRGAGGKLARSETVTVRLDPKLRYLAELGARKQRRTLSSFIESAVEHSLNDVLLREGARNPENDLSIKQEAYRLWDVDESHRFAMLALHYPEMLTHEEQKLWKLIWRNRWLLREETRKPGSKLDKESWTVDLELLRIHWETIRGVASGELDPSELPTSLPEDGHEKD